jgi:diguanylate cyclase (GGDEF)-like protein
MKAYLEVIRDCVGHFGNAYRGLGDETVALIVGQGHDRAVEIAEAIKKSVGSLRCTYKDKKLPTVTASMGVASAPPEARAMELETVAEERKRKAKRRGKNRVIAQ